MNKRLKHLCRVAIIAVLASDGWLCPTPVHAEEKKPDAKTDAAAKCEHGAIKSECYICTPALREKGRLWCKEHTRYEDRCWICHPEAQDKNRLYCKEHFLYEDECYLCHPELKKPAASETPKTEAAKPETASTGGLKCKEHNLLESECGICHPDLAAALEPGEGLKVRLASSEAATKAGVTTESPRVGPISGGLEVYAELEFNQNKLAQIVTPAEGIIQIVGVDLGSHVEEGAVLVTITSAAIGEAKGKYLRAVADTHLQEQNAARARKLQANQVSSDKEMQESVAAAQNASAALLQARQQLITFGFTEVQIGAFEQNPAEPAVLELRAPFAGEITERKAVRGALAKAGEQLFTLADRSTMWAILNLPENTVAKVQVGQRVELRVDALGQQTFTGHVTWVAAEVDDRTRMAKARVEVENPDGLLKAKMFARARVLSTQSDKAITVPESAIQHLDGKAFAFVKLQDDLYEARAVRIGAKQNGRLEIIKGLTDSQPVVTDGGHIVKSQFLISRLGAGCVD